MLQIFAAAEVAVYEYGCTGRSRRADALTDDYKAECDARLSERPCNQYERRERPSTGRRQKTEPHQQASASTVRRFRQSVRATSTEVISLQIGCSRWRLAAKGSDSRAADFHYRRSHRVRGGPEARMALKSRTCFGFGTSLPGRAKGISQCAGGVRIASGLPVARY